MAEVTISPIPYQNGTLDSYAARDVISLGQNKFFAIYSQRNPNYTFGMIFEVLNPKTSSPTVNILRNQILSDYSASSAITTELIHRIYKINDYDILVFRQQVQPAGAIDVSVLSYNPTTYTISKVNANTLTITIFTTNLSDFNIFNPTTHNPARLTAISPSENVLVYSIPNGGSQGKFVRINWNPLTKTLSETTLRNTSSIGTSGNGFGVFAKNIDNSSYSCVWVYNPGSISSSYRGYYVNASSFAIGEGGSFDATGSNYVSGTSTSSSAYGGVCLISTSTTRKIFRYGGTQYLLFPYGASITAGSSISGLTSTADNLVGLITLPENKALLIGSLNTNTQPTGPFYAQIINHVSNAVTPGTAARIEIADSTLRINQKLPVGEKIDDSLIVIYLFTTSGQFVLKFLYAA